jgi:hypothetical protein
MLTARLGSSAERDAKGSGARRQAALSKLSLVPYGERVMSKHQELIEAARRVVLDLPTLDSPLCNATLAVMAVQAVDRLTDAVKANTNAFREADDAGLIGDDSPQTPEASASNRQRSDTNGDCDA